MDPYDEDDDLSFYGLYDNGHWEFSEKELGLIFISDAISKEESILRTIVCGPIQFRDDIDLLEQQRYKKRFQRKTGDSDVVTLQDVKDLVLYTAPTAMLSRALINMLHLHSTARYLRGLILYIQYFIQISEVMSNREMERETKLRTPNTDIIELEYRDNLQELRQLVTKEYCTMVIGGAELQKYHHMGPAKKIRSVTRADAIFYEAFIRLSVQIVWVALGRRAFNQIELEVNRLFRSRKFNLVDHNRGTDSVTTLSPNERFVLLGQCVHLDNALRTRSPLLREVCSNPGVVDYRLLGLGVIDLPNLTNRHLYLERALVTPEIELQDVYSMTLGIIGLKRTRFDTVLKEIKQPVSGSSSSTAVGRFTRLSRVSTASLRRSVAAAGNIKMYPDIQLPKTEGVVSQLPDDFSSKSHPRCAERGAWCNNEQRKKWLARIARITAIRSKKQHTHNMLK